MGMNTFRYEPRESPPPPATYWKRRFLALVAGLAILAAIAWAFSGVLAADGGGAAAGTAGGSRGPGANAGGGAGTGGSGAHAGGTGSAGSGGPAGSGSSPGPAPSAAASAAAGAGHRSGAGSTPAPSLTQTTAPASGLPGHCKPSQIVISVFSSRSSYRRGQLPEFDVDVVSTADRTCAFNVGPKFLALVVTADGKRIWSSADCVGGRGSLMTNLARGVPTVLPVSWDRERSAPGCAATSRRVRAGSFAAAASDGGITSNPVPFKLRS